jgi:hypothetical protein
MISFFVVLVLIGSLYGARHPGDPDGLSLYSDEDGETFHPGLEEQKYLPFFDTVLTQADVTRLTALSLDDIASGDTAGEEADGFIESDVLSDPVAGDALSLDELAQLIQRIDTAVNVRSDQLLERQDSLVGRTLSQDSNPDWASIFRLNTNIAQLYILGCRRDQLRSQRASCIYDQLIAQLMQAGKDS